MATKGHPPYNINGEGGRPRKYTLDDIERFADELVDWMKNESRFWFKDFCLERGIDPDLMSKWARENDNFNIAYKLAKGLQESRIFKGSMTDTFNAGMAKFALMNNHGWSDKQETKVSGDAVNPLAFVLEQIDGKSKELVDARES
jgi:DNA-packaging protein gp3